MATVTLSFWNRELGTHLEDATLPVYSDVGVDVMKNVVASVAPDEAIELFKVERTLRWYRRNGKIVVQM